MTKRILIQAPSGLKKDVLKVYKKLENEGNEVFVSANPCYGACDIDYYAKQVLKADLILHFGHAPLANMEYHGVEFVETKLNYDVGACIRNALRILKKEERVGLLATIQHLHMLGKAKEILEKNGKKVVIPKAKGKIAYDGQIIGCYFEHAKDVENMVDAFVVIATGIFHALGLALAVDKKVIVADPAKNEAKCLDELKFRFLKKRYACIEKVKQAERIGIVVSVKPGQFMLDEARKIKKMLEDKGKDVYLIVADEISNEIENFGLDAYIIVACPRIVIDDAGRFNKPIIGCWEVNELLS